MSSELDIWNARVARACARGSHSSPVLGIARRLDQRCYWPVWFPRRAILGIFQHISQASLYALLVLFTRRVKICFHLRGIVSFLELKSEQPHSDCDSTGYPGAAQSLLRYVTIHYRSSSVLKGEDL